MNGDQKTDGEAKYVNQVKLANLFASHTAQFLKDKDRLERANKSIMQCLTRHLDGPDDPLPELPLPPGQASLSEVMAAYLALASLQHSLAQVEYYFRRFPFHDLPVSHSDHLRNICEMYFDRIEQFRQRLKALVNAVKKLSGKHDERYGSLITRFSAHFKWEQKQRNWTHHHRRFEYDAIDQLGLIEILRYAPEASILPSTRTIYRQEAKKWVSRVRTHSDVLAQVTEIAAGFVLEIWPAQSKSAAPPSKA